MQGLSEPNDEFHIWDRWLGVNRSESKQVLAPSIQQEMNHFFNTWLAVFNKPCLKK